VRVCCQGKGLGEGGVGCCHIVSFELLVIVYDG
jgi:hypothetical protein